MDGFPPELIDAVDDLLKKQAQPKATAPLVGAPPPAAVQPRIGAVSPQQPAPTPAPAGDSTPQIGAAQPSPAAPAKIGASSFTDSLLQAPPQSVGAAPGAGAPVDYASRYRDWASQEPKSIDPEAGKPSMLRKIGGIAAGAATGFFNPEAGAKIGGAIVNGPRHSLEMEQQQKEQAWERQGKEIQSEAGLANTTSEIQERRDKPALEAAKEAEAARRQQETFSQQQKLETERESAQSTRATASQAASEKGRQESEAASERRTQETIAASDRRTDKTIAAAEARGSNKSSPFDTKNAEAASKDVETARGGDFRYRSMAGSYGKAVKSNDQQAMLNLLTNHIGMTLGMQKGARITKDILREAQASTPWLQGVAAKFDSEGYLSGVVLTPQQMQQMMGLAETQRSNAWAQAVESARQAGVGDKVQIPADVKIRIQSPDGKFGTIPGNKLSEYEDHGYQVAPQ